MPAPHTPRLPPAAASDAAVAVAESPAIAPAPAEPKKIWRVGTLTYTTGGLIVLFCWLLFGDFSWSMRDRSVGPMAHWYLNHLKVPNYLFALLLGSFPALISVVLSPIISVKSDRCRSRWGRRIPFLLVTTPIAALGMIGVAITPIIARWTHTNLFPEQNEMVVAVVCFGIFWAAFEFATIAGHSVFGGLINDVVPRPLLGRFYGLFRAVSLIDGVIFNYWIMGKVPDHFTLILTIIGVFYGTAFLWVCFKVKEGTYPPPPPPAPAAKAGQKAGGFFRETKRYCKECFTNPYYLAIFLLLKIALMSFGPINMFAIPYARSLGVSMDTYGKCVSLSFVISLCLTWFLGWAADVFHPLRMAIGSLAAYLLLMILGVCCVSTANGFLAAWVAHSVISGCYYTSAASLAQRLFPRGRFAQFSSAVGIFTAAASITFSPLVGLLIDRTGGVYRYTFVVAAVVTTLALVAGFYVHGKFMKLGGPKNYVPPE
ncbi:MFS transporter [Geminisphaera colitermitum]|uniref:MFS transporter n=1 Tax=Geminisphaera colitermitum TaxID=1148786 RepID=UPI000158C9FD|nr:MFS transporter [Geminisphaera colitermitum]